MHLGRCIDPHHHNPLRHLLAKRWDSGLGAAKGPAMESYTSPSRAAAVVRLFWMLIGPVVLSVLSLFIVEKHRGWNSPESILFVVLLAVVVARYVDPVDSRGHRHSRGQRFFELAFLSVLGVGGWFVANALGASWYN
jgi:hypothetical protein